jgi:hypothetical protein
MQRIRRKKTSNFVTICNKILRRNDLSLKAKGLYAVVMGLPEDWELSITGLAAVLKEGKDAVSATIKELISFGYCQYSVERDAQGRITSHDYLFTEEPETPGGPAPEADQPDPGFPDLDKPDQGNPPQYNIEELNGSSKELPDRQTDSEPKVRTPRARTRKPSEPVHPAILAVREVTARFPDKVIWPLLIKTIGDKPDIERLQEMYLKWRAKGASPTNYSWVTEWYAADFGGQQPGDTKAQARAPTPEMPKARLDYPMMISMQMSAAEEKWRDRELYEHARDDYLAYYQQRGADEFELCSREVAEYESSPAFERRFSQ